MSGTEVQTYMFSGDLQEVSRTAQKNIEDFAEYLRQIADYLNTVKENSELHEAGFTSFLKSVRQHMDVLRNAKELLQRTEPDLNTEMKIVVDAGISQIDSWVVKIENQVSAWRKVIEQRN